MKASELRKNSTCAVCARPLCHSGLPLVWRVSFERLGILLEPVRRTDGLAAFLGSAKLADIMGSDEEATQTLCESVGLMICEPCAMESPIVRLIEAKQ